MADNSSERDETFIDESGSSQDGLEKSLSPKGGGDDGALERSNTTESIKYPPMAKIILIMLAIYISIFLIALVSPQPETYLFQPPPDL